ncbi:hypothetical protein DPEC_G00353110 [Dallia pectoralis]|uniref:Uncharacterized protein n=1 Tax=Dallia pectoralis TaxID=75939 RepID=A0ACC2F297_DALPE|nr:hypothetical protein DPEC_G00353110 [Dallia pectoralis]
MCPFYAALPVVSVIMPVFHLVLPLLQTELCRIESPLTVRGGRRPGISPQTPTKRLFPFYQGHPLPGDRQLLPPTGTAGRFFSPEVTGFFFEQFRVPFLLRRGYVSPRGGLDLEFTVTSAVVYASQLLNAKHYTGSNTV